MVASSTTIAAMCQGQGPRGKLREDGRMVHDMYLVEAKTPAESSGPWDYYKIIAPRAIRRFARLAKMDVL
jgi:hypothetical protein